MSRNELSIQNWMVEHEISTGVAWRRDIVEGRDPFGLNSDTPQIDKIARLRDDFGASPLYYYCFVADPAQFKKLVAIMPKSSWFHMLANQYYRSPLYYIPLGGRLDTVQCMMEWLFLSEDHLSPREAIVAHLTNQRGDLLGGFTLDLVSLGGHTAIIQWVLSDEFETRFKHSPTLGANYLTRSMIFSIFKYGSLEIVEWALSERFPKKYTDMVMTPAYLDDNFLLHGMENTDPEVIKFLLTNADHINPTVVCSATYGSKFYEILTKSPRSVIEWLFSANLPPLARRAKDALQHFYKDYDGCDRSNFHMGVRNYGICRTLFQKDKGALPTEFVKLLSMRDKAGETFLHCLAVTGHSNRLLDFISVEPELAASQWVNDKCGRPFDDINFFHPKKRKIITAGELLQKAIREALTRVMASYPDIDSYDLRLLMAFQRRVELLLREMGLSNKQMLLTLESTGILHTLYPTTLEMGTRVILKLYRYEEARPLTPQLLCDLISDVSPLIAPTPPRGIFSVFSPPTPSLFVEFIDKLATVRDRLQVDASDNLLKEDVVTTLNFLITRKEYQALPPAERQVFSMIRDVLCKTPEIRVLTPAPEISEGVNVPVENIGAELSKIEADAQSITDDEIRTKALLVISGVQYLLPHFDELNAFTKAHPQKLFFLDSPDKSTDENNQATLPFHIANYGKDDALRDSLVRLSLEYLAAYAIAKSAGKSTEFFARVSAGYCFEARIRDITLWAATLTKLQTEDELMEQCVKEYNAYIAIMYGVTNRDELTQPATDFIAEHHENEPYVKHNRYELALWTSEATPRLDPKMLSIKLSDDKMYCDYQVFDDPRDVKRGQIPLSKLPHQFGVALAEKSKRELMEFLPSLHEIIAQKGHMKPPTSIERLSRDTIEAYLVNMLSYPERQKAKGLFSRW